MAAISVALALVVAPATSAGLSAAGVAIVDDAGAKIVGFAQGATVSVGSWAGIWRRTRGDKENKDGETSDYC